MENKRILSADIISNSIQCDHLTPKIVWGWILCIMSAFGFMGCLIGGDISSILLGLLLAGPLLYFGIRLNKTAKRNKANLQARNYKIVKTLCIGYEDHSDSDGEMYQMKFENGASFSDVNLLGKNGDIFYLVYLADIPNPAAAFNGRLYLPSHDLVIEE